MDPRGYTFLVTGGGSGLGAASAHVLVEAGAHVVLLDRDEAALAATVEALGRERAAAVSGDVVVPADVERALAAADVWDRPLGGVVHCAGVAIAAKTVTRGEPHDLELFRKVVDVNLVGSFNVLRLAAARLVANEPNADGERGVVILTASIAAFEGQIGQVAYAASKGGVVGMTLPAARDLARDGVRVVTIAPGLFDTRLLAMLPAEAREALGKQVPFPSRLGRPEEFGRLALAIVENPMLNGSVIRLDGALRMPPR